MQLTREQSDQSVMSSETFQSSKEPSAKRQELWSVLSDVWRKLTASGFDQT